jgi:uncharacterized protein YgiB involved in biofilm formation
MRKSRYVTMLLAGAAAASLSACDQTSTPQDDAMLYSDPAACSKDADATLCNEAFQTARDEHVKQAPKFASRAECEAAGYTTCDTAEVTAADGTSQSLFMPMMMGFMMGRMLNGGMAGMAPRPVYADRNGYLYSDRANVGRVAPGTTSLGPNGMAMRTTRGGFGNSARAFRGGT